MGEEGNGGIGIATQRNVKLHFQASFRVSSAPANKWAQSDRQRWKA